MEEVGLDFGGQDIEKDMEKAQFGPELDLSGCVLPRRRGRRCREALSTK
jgi:hypothetical protein